MSLGSWDPTIESADTGLLSEQGLLQRLAEYGQSETAAALEEQLGDADKQRLAGLIQVEHEAWRASAEPLSNEEIFQLIRFFALAENLPGWEAGDKSPVIPLAKTLRSRGEKLDRDFLKWLRSVNDNRFLPYGPL